MKNDEISAAYEDLLAIAKTANNRALLIECAESEDELINRLELAAELEDIQNMIVKANNEVVEKIEDVIKRLLGQDDRM